MKIPQRLANLIQLPRYLSVQLSVLVSLLLIVTIGALGWITARTQTNRLEHAAHSHAVALTESVIAASLPHLLVDDLASVEDQLLRYNALPGVMAIQAMDRDGRVLSETALSGNGIAYPLYRRAVRTPPAQDETVVATNADGDLESWLPIRSGSERIGWVRLCYSLADVRAVHSRILTESILAALLAITVNVLLLLFYLRRPLRAIHDAARFSAALNLRRGEELAVQAETAEIGQLQEALNFASRQLWEDHRAAQESTERLQAILAYTAEGILTLDENGRIESINPAAQRIFGTTDPEPVGRQIDTLIPDWHLARSGVRREMRGRHTDGRIFPIEIAVSDMWVGQEHLFTLTVRDLTETRRLEQLSSRLGRILDHSSNEIYIFDAETLKFVQINQGALTNLDYAMDELRVMTPLDIKPGMSHEQFTNIIQPLRSGEQTLVQFETVHRRKDGSLYPVEIRLQLSPTENPPVFVAIAQDITARKHAEARLVYLANYDTLTDLPNRMLLIQRLRRATEEAEFNERLVAVLFVDLDRFKVINDTLGHDAGDELLKVVARRLSEAVRPGDTVARYGGDEFVIVLAKVAHVDDVTRVVQKILGRLTPGIVVGGRELFVTPSIGITLFPFDDRSPEELLRNADAAMFQAKEQGGNTYQFYTAELNTRAQRRLTMETSLRHALERGEFLLHYQAQVEVSTGAIVGAEALLRWQHPEWGLVPPGEFVPLAEETGLILPIGEWVLRTACAQAQSWRTAGHKQLRVAVNLSGRQLAQKSLPAMLERVLHESGLERGMLEIEVTESLLMQDLEQTAATLDALASLGLTVSMDDFGTGYSSLSYLKRLPIDVLKIDQSFVRDISTDADDAAIVQAIIAMAHGLGIRVVAEGVETTEQLAFLRRHHCDFMQGNYAGRPLPPERFTELLGRRERARG